MKKLLLLTIAGLYLLSAARPAQAAYLTGAELKKYCESDKPSELFSCMNYVAGVIDYHVMMQSLGTTPTTDFCLPENLPLETASVVVMEYLKNAPQDGAFIAAPAVTMALHEKYPCGPVVTHRKKKKKHG